MAAGAPWRRLPWGCGRRAAGAGPKALTLRDIDWHSLVDPGFVGLTEPVMLRYVVAPTPETRTQWACCEAFLAQFKSDVGAATAAVHAPRPPRGR